MAISAKKILTLSALIATLSAGVQANDHRAEINLGIGRILFGNELEDDTNYHLGLGYVIDDRWTLEVVANEYEAQAEDVDIDVRGTQYRLDALYHFSVDTPWRPYFAFGAGDQRLSPEGGEPAHDTLLNAGFGIKNRFARNWEWRTDVRAFNSLDEEYTDVVFSTGISFLFGVNDSKPAPVAAPEPVAIQEADSDGDGVLDSKDKCPDTPRRYKVDADGCPMKLTETVSMKLAVNFDTNSAVVKDEFIQEVRDLATFMNQYENTEVTVEGHTDSSGSDAYNKALSQRRADAVRDVLVQRLEIEADRVKAIGYGEERPTADNSTVEGREANRRVVGAVSTRVTTTETRE